MCGSTEVTRERLAREIAERNDRCGHVDNNQICLRPKHHQGEHVFEHITRTIPFATK